MKACLLFALAACATASSVAAQSHTPIVVAPWVGFETPVNPPVTLTDSDAVGNPIYGRADATAYADPTLAAVAGVAFLDPGDVTQIEASIGNSSGSSGSYNYIGTTQGVVQTQANASAGGFAQILDPVDVFGSVQAYYTNSCGGSLLSRASLGHTSSSGIGGQPIASLPENFTAICEANQFTYNASTNGVVLVRAYTGGYVFVRLTAWTSSSTILTQE